jgi:transposase
MKVKTKEVRNVVRIIDEIIKHYKDTTEFKKRDWKTYEQRVSERIKTAIREFSPLVDKAIAELKFLKEEKRGNKPKLVLKQKVVLLLTQRLIGKSNRNMANMLLLFSLLNEIDVSYKTVERLYSDPGVILALNNLHELLLSKKGVKQADCAGDGTGYTLTIKEHYASAAQALKEKAKIAKKISKKRKKVFVYYFTILDIKTRMYVAYGTSFQSEKEAFLSAIKMAKDIGIEVKDLRLDRYYSGQAYVELILKELGNVKITLIPKSNATVRGCWEWKRILHDFVKDPITYLEDYFKRTQSESSFAEDKKRTGWMLTQRREDRVDTASFCNLIWHNLFWLG